jgi:hypothetical protein
LPGAKNSSWRIQNGKHSYGEKKHSEYRSISKKSIDGHSQIAVIFFPEAKSSWKYG